MATSLALQLVSYPLSHMTGLLIHTIRHVLSTVTNCESPVYDATNQGKNAQSKHAVMHREAQ